jgi:acetyl-CoA C-acetyltransferase
MAAPIFVLGGYQTDFARNWSKENKHIVAMLREVVAGGLEATGVDPKAIDVAHVGNFAAELYAMQGHLGAFLVDTDPAFSGLPTSRHEAACASGSIAILAASAEIEAGRYDCAMVVGVEQMKTVDAKLGGDYLGTAAWYEREANRSQGRAPGAHCRGQLLQRQAQRQCPNTDLVYDGRPRPLDRQVQHRHRWAH